MNTMHLTRSIAPEWAVNCDSTADITDNLFDADPQARASGEESCTAYFDHAEGMAAWQGADYPATLPRLIGISIATGWGAVSYHSDKDAALILGADAIDRIEAVQAETVA